VRGAAAAQLGADVARTPDGRWLVTRVLPGESSDPHARSPFTAPGVAVREGDEILEVDGRPVDPVYGPWPALAGTADKPVELTIRPADPDLVPRPPAGPADEDGDEDGDAARTAAKAGEMAARRDASRRGRAAAR
jgi:tricorn protease